MTLVIHEQTREPIGGVRISTGGGWGPYSPPDMNVASFHTRQGNHLSRVEEVRHRLLNEQTKEVFIRYQLDGTLLEVAPACRLLLGHAPEDLIGCSYYHLVHPDDLPAIKARQWSWTQASGIFRHRFRLRRKDGTWVWFELTAEVLRDPRSGDGREIVGLARDITEQLTVEAGRKAYESRYRDLFERSQSGIFLSSLDGRLLNCNEAFVKMFEYDSRDELVRMGTKGLYSSTNVRQQYVNQVLERGCVTNLELCMRRRDGRPVWVLANVTLINDEDGEPAILEGVVVDITRQKQAEQRLINSQAQLRLLAAHLQSVREEEKARMAREIHDELGGALTGLKFDLCALDDLFDESDRAAHNRLDRLADAIDETLRTVRRIATELRPATLDLMGLKAAIESFVHKFEERTGIECELALCTENFALDPARSTAIFRILQESLTNVARHSGARRVRIRISRAPSFFSLLIRDNGTGIKAQNLESPHSLGLSGMRERLRPWNGSLKIAGEAGKGTVIRARIPTPAATEE